MLGLRKKLTLLSLAAFMPTSSFRIPMDLPQGVSRRQGTWTLWRGFVAPGCAGPRCRGLRTPAAKNTKADMDEFACYMKTRHRQGPAASYDEYRKLPSVVTWRQPKCFMQARPKTEMFRAQNDAGRQLYSLGCSENEFRHILASSGALESTPISTIFVDLGSEEVCSDLRGKWAAGVLFLKDLGPGDLLKTSGPPKSRQETLVETIADNLEHLQHFQHEPDHMTRTQMRQWLDVAWQGSHAAGHILPTRKLEGERKREGNLEPDSEPLSPKMRHNEEESAGTGQIWTDNWVNDCSFDPERSLDETGAVLLPLLRWFNAAFPYYRQQCAVCGEELQTHLLATTKASPSEQTFEALRTELYHCGACDSHFRIPRYNQIRKILAERRGRCGEYSMVFYHLMSALDYETRWVVDWSDHCWVEILVGDAWVHMDPSVGIWNDKDMYKNDWDKRHMFVLAFCADGCEDVTAAYADDMVQVWQRRDLTEAAFAQALAAAQDRNKIGIR